MTNGALEPGGLLKRFLARLIDGIIVSIMLGKRPGPGTTWGKWALWSGTTLLVLFAWYARAMTARGVLR